jgi:hypothetical protein
MVNVQKQKQKKYEKFKNDHINALVGEHVLLYRRDGADDVIYEYILVDGSVKGWFKYHDGIVTFEKMIYPEVVQDVVPN